MATDNNGEKDSKKKKLTGNYEISVEDDEGKEYKCTLKPPSRFVVQPAMAKMMKSTGEMDMLGAGEIVFNSCKLECDPEILKNDKLLTGVYLQCASLIEVAEATIKKI